MLQSLTIRNIAVIDRLHVEFEKGFSVFTGETGAGKSILLDSLSFVLGNRSSFSKLIREGEEEASVTLVLEHLPPLVTSLLQDQGFESDLPLIIRRTLHREGKTKAFLNDQPISVSLLNQISAHLIEIHGQFDHLLSPAQQLEALDRYAYIPTETVHQAYQQWKKEEDALSFATQNFRDKEKRLEELNFLIEEIQTLNPKMHEEEELLSLKEQGKNTDQLKNIVTLITAVFEGPLHIENKFLTLQRQLEKLSISSLSALKEPIGTILVALQDLRERACDLEFSIEHNSSQSLDDIESRLYALRQLARKYQTSTDELVLTLKTLEQERETFLKGDFSLENLTQRVHISKENYKKLSETIHGKREKAGKELAKAIENSLISLKLPHAKFCIIHEELPEAFWSGKGMYHVEFHISTNPGLSPGPLSKIASGGELSRVMLALKSILKEKSQIPTLIFDEVDVGLGGAVASAMGEKLSLLSANSQILAITHSPQLAAYADHHFGVSKSVIQGKTITCVQNLNHQQRIEELSRMLSGKNITDLVRAAAEELLKDKVH